MKTAVLDILCDPITHGELKVVNGDSRNNFFLQDSISKKRYAVQNDLVFFLEENSLEGSNKKYQALYNKFAPVYDFLSKMVEIFSRKNRREYLDEIQIDGEGNRILEVSLGTGENLTYLPANNHYFGIDISLNMLKRVVKKIHKRHLTADVFLAQAEALPFKDNSFDVVFHVGGINFFNDKQKAINEMIRVAKPCSQIVIIDETEKAATAGEKMPLISGFFKNRAENIVAPINVIPKEMLGVKLKEVHDGGLFVLSFRKPSEYFHQSLFSTRW
jgi:ubiquinone/menaquinone biosynthesis C-methylase UbiE